MRALLPGLRSIKTILPVVMLVVALTGCGGGEVPSPQPQGQSTATAAGGSAGESSQPAATGVPTAGQQATGAPAPAQPASGGDTDWSRVDLCKLLTKQEVEAALGPGLGPIGDDMAPDPAYSAATTAETRGSASCRYKDPDGIPAALVAIGPLAMWDAEHDSAFASSEDVAPQSISGIGDDAFTWSNTLVAKWLSKGVTIRVTLNFQDPFQPDQAKQLAQKVFDRLP